MIAVLRRLVRLVGALWVLALGLLALAITLYCVDGAISLGSGRPDRLVGLGTIHHKAGSLLHALAAPGSVALLSLLGGLGAMLLGLVLLVGLFGRSRERLAILDSGGKEGRLAARRRPLRDMLVALARQARGATAVKRPRLAPSRHGRGGRVKLKVARASIAEPSDVQRAVDEAVAPLSEPFGLKSRVQVSLGQRGQRVQ